jgi:hypothetical protein
VSDFGKRRSKPAIEQDGRYRTPTIREKWSIPPEVQVAELSIKRWQIIAGICTILGGGLTACAGTAVSVATALRPKDEETRKIAEETKKTVDQVSKELAELKAEIRAQGTSGPTTRLVRAENRIDYLAVFIAKVNGQVPTVDGYPQPMEGVWTQDVAKTKPVPMKMKGGPWPK